MMHTVSSRATKLDMRQGWTLNLSWSDIKVRTKNRHGCFEINSVFRTSVTVRYTFFPDLSRA